MIWLKTKYVLLLLVLLAAVLVSAVGTEVDLAKFGSAANMIAFIGERWLPPDWSVLPSALRMTAVTLEIAFLGTFLAVVAALPLSFLAAKNMAPPFIYNITRALLSFLRSVPEIVFGLIFVVVVGLGPFPAVLAIILHNIGVLGKLVSELVEASERGPQEALRSVGATRPMIALYGILPQLVPHILSNYFYRLEVAVRTSLILGLIGAGGIGQQLFLHFKLFQYEKVAVDVLAIMALVVAIDYCSAWIRSRVI